MTLRINQSKINRDDYLAQLQAINLSSKATEFSGYGITLAEPCDPKQLPGFEQGLVSVQDEAAQLAARLLDLKPGLHVLDACAAPGGKTCHMLEAEPALASVLALDISDKRLRRVQENIDRIFSNDSNTPALSSKIHLKAADVLATKDWFDGQLFDRILLDAPCSATGVIRRHPDIKLLRLANQVEQLATLQLQMLKALWSILKPGGRLVYATCSVFPTENTQVLQAFLNEQADAQELVQNVPWGQAQPVGRQLLPRPGGHDGFYYGVLGKLVSCPGN